MRNCETILFERLSNPFAQTFLLERLIGQEFALLVIVSSLFHVMIGQLKNRVF